MEEAEAEPSCTYSLHEGEELRLEAGPNPVHATLLSGSAEVFGAELELHRRVRLHDTKIAIFTWDGCTVKVDGTPLEPAYTSDDTPMVQYLNVSHAIDKQRDAARDSGQAGPNIVLVGPTDVGKSTLAKIFTNYAIRGGWSPLLVDTDVGQGMFAMPGCIAASMVQTPIEPEEGLYTDAPVVFFFGHTTPAANLDLYRSQVDGLATLCEKRSDESEVALKAAGAIVNTLGWVEGQGRELQEHVCRAFSSSTICVIGDEKLHSSLKMSFRDTPQVQVVKLPKSGGCVSLNSEVRKAMRDSRVQEYYTGRNQELTSHTHVLPFASFKLYKVAGNTGSYSGLLPAGATSGLNPLRVIPVDATDDLVGAVLGVSYAQKPQDIVSVNVAGFVWVMQLDVNDKSMTIMCPNVTPPPNSIFIVGSIKSRIKE